MKNKIIFLIAIATTFIACEKSPFDYRNKYVGNYNFTNIYTDVDSVWTISNTTSVFLGKVKTEGDNNMIIEFEADKSQSLRIDNDGNVYNSCDTYIGRFESESSFQAVLNKQSCTAIVLEGSTSVAIVGDRKY